jgi:hypothetical protein
MKPVKADGAKGVTNQRFPKGSTGNTGGYVDVAHELKERYLRISGRWEDLFQVRELTNNERGSLLFPRL